MKNDWIEVNLPYYSPDKKDFGHSEYNRSGVLIECNGKKYLIGDIDKNGGGCGCCAELGSPFDLVTKCKVLDIDMS